MFRAYLDNAATTPLDERVRAAMEPWLSEEVGNPSSRHPAGVRASEALDRARVQVARTLGVRSEAVVFTSGGTEANNLGVLGAARAALREVSGKPNVVVGPTEHPCVRKAADALTDEGFDVRVGRVAPDGSLDLEHLAGLLDEDTLVVAQMLVQNELGTIYPVREVARLARARAPRAHVHVDAVQALGKLDLDLEELGADSVAVSAHKIHGPKGAGALVLREGARRPRPLVFGGGQEDGLRAGTENVAALVGFGLAAELAVQELAATARATRTARSALRAGLSRLHGARELPFAPASTERTVPSVDAICALHIPGIPAEVRMHHLAVHGVFTSPGAACQARRAATSPALLALGLGEYEAREVLRFSFSRFTTPEEVAGAVEALVAVEAELEAVR